MKPSAHARVGCIYMVISYNLATYGVVVGTFCGYEVMEKETPGGVVVEWGEKSLKKFKNF